MNIGMKMVIQPFIQKNLMCLICIKLFFDSERLPSRHAASPLHDKIFATMERLNESDKVPHSCKRIREKVWRITE